MMEDKAPILPTISEKAESSNGKASVASNLKKMFISNGNDKVSSKKKEKVGFFEIVETCLIVICVVVLVVFLPIAIYNVGHSAGFKYSHDNVVQPLYRRNVFLANKIRGLQSQIIDERNLQLQLKDEQTKVEVLRRIIEDNMDEQEIDQIVNDIQHVEVPDVVNRIDDDVETSYSGDKVKQP